MGPTALLPLRRKSCQDFIALKSPSSSVGFEAANLGYNGKHAKDYTPEGDKAEISTYIKGGGKTNKNK
jgi:hypothetical protein